MKSMKGLKEREVPRASPARVGELMALRISSFAESETTTSQVKMQDANPKGKGLEPDVPERSKDKI